MSQLPTNARRDPCSVPFWLVPDARDGEASLALGLAKFELSCTADFRGGSKEVRSICIPVLHNAKPLATGALLSGPGCDSECVPLSVF